ncbi:MAG: sulfur carrier protein ThiS adenylyltransferase ThiF [Firmicutes bacterium]|nr:sulfur carrier protein ThiS adenylyltransferase ThiF [Bacillota bacterium]
MEIELNGKIIRTEEKSLKKFVQKVGDGAQVVIYNGFQVDMRQEREIKDGDIITLIKKGVMPDKDELEAMICARFTPGLYRKFKNAKVAVAGLGGLGSNIAAMLARSAVGKLLLVDFDTVEPSNLNRQNYYIKHLGMKKCDAMKEIIKEIDPFIEVECKCVRLGYENCAEVLKGYKYICEAFDGAESKAMITEVVCGNMSGNFDGSVLVAASGMAGIEDANEIKTVKRMKNLYVCGDMVNGAQVGRGLMAPRVAICAGHQANMILRLIAEEKEDE